MQLLRRSGAYLIFLLLCFAFGISACRLPLVPAALPSGYAYSASQPATASPSPAASTRTPFVPLPVTPTPTQTLTPTPTATFTPTATLTATPLPAEAYLSGLYGYPQAYELSCESRSAADWARYFGVAIDELDFLSRLPHSDDPNLGFVGSPHGWYGQIPPQPYGVHARPVARLLRDYGLDAKAHTGFTFQQLQAEISTGRPVIVWVVGQVVPGTAETYTTQAGEKVTVARFEHTVIVTGYGPDSVTVLDNHLVYSRSLSQFLDSWGVLGSLAVTLQPY